MLHFIECRYRRNINGPHAGILIHRTVINSDILADFLLWQATNNPTVEFNSIDFSGMNQFLAFNTKQQHRQEWIKSGNRFKLIPFSC